MSQIKIFTLSDKLFGTCLLYDHKITNRHTHTFYKITSMHTYTYLYINTHTHTIYIYIGEIKSNNNNIFMCVFMCIFMCVCL